MFNLRLFLTLLAAVLLTALVVALVMPRVSLADGAGPAQPAGPAGLVNGRLGAGGGAGSLWTGTVGPAQVLLGECTALPCLLELDIGGRPGYLIVDYPNPRG